ncbi:MAG: SMI1/KNR4 family protein [Actinomycetaceae bacterium]|nr:SMI1/KNR4 family protein [Actinomycetaceae bacterium]
MSVVDRYLAGLKAAYQEYDLDDVWDEFIEETGPQKASEEELQAIRDLYPLVPETLLELLARFNGTNGRGPSDERVPDLLCLSSDVGNGSYPYYLLSATEIIENKDTAHHLAGYIDREYEHLDWVTVDPSIGNNSKETRWLHFSDCMNNGGTSQLFIDFTPSQTGTVGQIVRFLHDPDDLSVIANSFDEYLQKVIDDQYVFLEDVEE